MLKTSRIHLLESPTGIKWLVSNKLRMASGGYYGDVDYVLSFSGFLISPPFRKVQRRERARCRGGYFSLFSKKWFRKAVKGTYDKEDWQYRVWIASERVAELWEDCPIDILKQNEVSLRTMRHRLRLISAKGAKDV